MFSVLAHNYLTRGFWGDEAWTSMISRLPYSQMLKTTAGDFHPPGYYTVIEFIYKFFPPTEVITRLASIAFFLLTIIMVYKLASYVKGRQFGILSAVVVSVNPIFFKYAFEARNYTMFAFAATASVFFLLELSKNFNKFRAFFFVLFTALGLYTHYYMVFILGAEGLFLLLFDRKIFWRMMGLYTIVGILFLPWLKVLVGQIASVGSSYWIPPINFKHTYFDAFERILGGESQSIWRTVLFSLSLMLLVVGIFQHLVKKRFEKPYLMVWLWAIVPFALASLPGLSVGGLKLPFRPIFFWRYLIGASVPLSMAIVLASQNLPRQAFKVAIAAVIILSVLIDGFTFASQPRGFREEYQDKVIGKIASHDTIVTVLPSFAEVAYYRDRYNLTNKLVVLPEGLVQSSGKSLLDTYVLNGSVTLSGKIGTKAYLMTPGPTVEIKSNGIQLKNQ